MKRMILYLAIPLFAGMVSCENFWIDCIEGNGKLKEENRAVPRFKGLVSTGDFDLYVSKAHSISLRIEAEENIIEQIRTRVVDNKLYIDVRDNKCIRNLLPVKVYLNTPTLNRAELTGSGQIACDTVVSEEFLAVNTGSGDIEIRYLETGYLEASLLGSGNIEMGGKASRSKLEILGSGNIRTIGLEQEKCEGTITGSGDMFVYVTSELNAEILGSENIYYKGNPVIHSTITGTGKVMKY